MSDSAKPRRSRAKPGKSADDIAMVDIQAASPTPATPALRPASAVSSGVGLAGMAALLGWFFIARHYRMDGELSAITSVGCVAIAMCVWSLLVDKVHRNPSTGIDWSLRRDWADVHKISAVKIAGLWATWAIIGFFYCVFRFYWSGPYGFAMHWIGIAMVPVALLSIPYVLWLDRRLVDPRDGAWHFGEWLMGGEDYDVDKIWRHMRLWAVKGFYTAFMVSIVPGNFLPILLRPVDVILSNPLEFGAFLVAFTYLVDVHFATVGYILTMRPLDAHIRTANPYGMGWVAALICYPPFVLMNPGGPLFYGEDSAGFAATGDISHGWYVWAQYFHVPMPLVWGWAALLVALCVIYAWATVAFGLRFSNLTHRGIITHGPYAWTRHPAYLAKNAYWWLAGLVLLPWDGNLVQAVRNVTLLAMVSGVYYWRAKTEEKHLLGDPAYVAYWEWAQEHAPIPRLFRRLSGLARPMVRLEPDPRVGPVI